MRFVVDDFAEGVFDRDPLVQRELTQLRAELDRCSRSLERLGARWGELRGEQPVSLCLSDLQKGVTESLPQSIRGRVIWTASSDQKICLPKESLTHVVGALVRNGIEASQEGKSVTVNGGIDHRAITIQVVDSGVGMSSQDLSRIGTPFFTTKDSGRGMGLGLFIAKLFADRLGGALEVKSDLGSGTSISLTIPNSGV
jgi:two-component system sensor histidine kinase RegB